VAGSLDAGREPEPMTEFPSTTPARGAYAPKSWQACWRRVLHALPPGKTWRRLALWPRKPLENMLVPAPDIAVWGLILRLHSRGNPVYLLVKASYRPAGQGRLNGIYRLDQ
jgi:hypothetical protein